MKKIYILILLLALTGLSAYAQPANDNCSGAVVLPVGTSCVPVAGTVAGATASPPVTACWGTVITDVWYTFTANASTQTCRLTCSPNFYGVEEVFNLCGGASLACSGSGPGMDNILNVSGLIPGNIYYIRVYDYYTPSTSLGFNICVYGSCSLSQGPDSALNFINDASIGAYAWNNPNSACCSDNNYAIAGVVGSGGVTNYLKATAFGFSIPSNASICGIEMKVERKTIVANTEVDNEIKLVKNNLVTGANRALPLLMWGINDSVVTYGSNSDLWGTTWTPADVNSALFGAVVSVAHLNNTTDFPRVDQITIRVYYSISTSTASVTSFENEFYISPNPSSGLFTINMENVTGKMAEVEIYNVLGEKVYKSDVKSQKEEINLSNQPKGIYFVKIIADEKVYEQKIVIE